MSEVLSRTTSPPLEINFSGEEKRGKEQIICTFPLNMLKDFRFLAFFTWIHGSFREVRRLKVPDIAEPVAITAFSGLFINTVAVRQTIAVVMIHCLTQLTPDCCFACGIVPPSAVPGVAEIKFVP